MSDIKKQVDNALLAVIPPGVTPNGITGVRALLGAIAVWVYWQQGFGVAALVFALASFTDYLDGLVARARDMATEFGKAFDELVDKGLIWVALGAVIAAAFSEGYVLQAYYLTALLAATFARDVLMTTWRRRQMLQVPRVLFAARVKTAVQMVSVGVLLWAGDEQGWLHIGSLLLTVATVLSLVSAYTYRTGKRVF